LYAHTPNGAGEWHGLAEHLESVARLAGEFAEPFGGAAHARAIGLLHDLGKANPKFQNYLQLCAREPDRKHETTDHKGAGTLALRAQVPGNEALLWAVAGHHGGLMDKRKLGDKLKQWKDETPPNLFVPDLPPLPDAAMLALPEWANADPHAFDLFTRLLSSALFDADCLDTEAHGSPEATALRHRSFPTIEALAEKMTTAQLSEIGKPGNAVKSVRDELARSCLREASRKPGLFRITAPTGSGKTRSALSFALKHAQENGLRRVISVAPYLSITDQTADSYRALLGSNALLEHHSDAGRNDRDEGDQDPEAIWRRLAAQTWDAPVIVTTAVQFFESLFSNKTSKLRKVHRIAKSVVIIDEVQTLPTELLNPMLDMLRLLIKHAGVSVVLCTATQPPYERIRDGIELPEAIELAPNKEAAFAVLSRVSYVWPVPNEPAKDWDEIAEIVRGEPQILAVLNTRKDSLALLEALGDDDALYLSTLLCAEHRRAVIAEIKQRLNEGDDCRVISTQVVEAGVDLDFPTVLRALGPFDRIVQAAGRCNREGKLTEKGRMIVVDPKDGGTPIGPYRTGTDVTAMMIGREETDPDRPETVERYFATLFHRTPLDRNFRNKTTKHEDKTRPIQRMRRERDFESVAETFWLIPDSDISVLVPYKPKPDEESPAYAFREEVLSALRGGRSMNRKLAERLQPFLVTLPYHAAQQALTNKRAEELSDGLLFWIGPYDSQRGIVLEGNALNDVWIM
jgi:CRISPR-associated endonuclease/helicase Cas3